MWDSPSWLSAAITGKINERVASANRSSNENIAQLNRQSNEAIAEANRISNEGIAAANRINTASIADKDREAKVQITAMEQAAETERNQARVEATKYGADLSYASGVAQRELDRDLTAMKLASNEKIASNQIESNEWITLTRTTADKEIAAAQRALTASENALQRSWQAGENQLSRENSIEIAKINAASNIGSSTIRMIPVVLGTGNSNSGGSNNGNSNFKFVPQTGKTTEAQRKADNLFPELSPTFKSSALALSGALLLSAASGFLNFVPFI